MSENINNQPLPVNNETQHAMSVRGYLGKIASSALEIGFVSSVIVGGTELATKAMGEGDHLSIPVATAMAAAIYASKQRRKNS